MSRIPLFTRGIIRNRPFWVYFLIALGVQYLVSFAFAVATWVDNYRWIPSPGITIWDSTIMGTGALLTAYLTNSMEVLVYGYRPFMNTSTPPDWVITLNLIFLGLPIAIILSLLFAWHCKRRNKMVRMSLIVLLIISFANSTALWIYRNNSLVKSDGYWLVNYTYPNIAVAAARDDLRSVERMIRHGSDIDCLDKQGHTLLYRIFFAEGNFLDLLIVNYRGLNCAFPISYRFQIDSDVKRVEGILLQNGAVFNASDLVEIRKRLESFTNIDFSDAEWSQMLSVKGSPSATERLALLISLDNAWDESDDRTGIIRGINNLNFRFAFGGVNNRTPLHYAVYLDSVFAVGRLISTPLLLNAGADSSIKDGAGETAFDLAVRIWPDEKKEIAEDWQKIGYKPEDSGE